MEEKLEFEDLYKAYELCLKNKKRKLGTYEFINDELCKNLMKVFEELSNYDYKPSKSNCYVVTEPALREIYAAQFKDRIVQHFYINEIEKILNEELVDGCCSCRKNKGTDYALMLLKKFLTDTSNNGKSECFYLKIDLSGYFMSIDRKQVSGKFTELIKDKYKGKYKKMLLYLTPIIFEENPALNCEYRCSYRIREKVPERRKMFSDSDYGMAIGNLTAQAASNLNLSNFDKYVINELKLKKYIRYVDDIVIISESKEKLVEALVSIQQKLNETHQKMNDKKTKIDTAYHGVQFLGKISYPYGYQKPSKQVIIRTNQKAKKFDINNIEEILARTNSQIGSLKKYNCRRLVLQYSKILSNEIKNLVDFNENQLKFSKRNY